MSYTIRTATVTDIALMLEWAKTEGWNPGIHDLISFHVADPNGFFVGCVDDTPVSSLSAVRYSDIFAFVGLYIVKPEFRGKGLGVSIWDHGMDYIKDVQITGLDGVVEQQKNYMKYGFQLAHRNVRYAGTAPNKIPTEDLTDLNEIPIKDIAKFEHELFPCDRSGFLSSWIAHADSAVACIKDGEMLGYGIIRKCGEGFKIGPLFATNYNIAEQIFLGLCRKAGKENIYIDIPMPNTNAIQLAEKYHFTPVFETARMYTNAVPKLDLSKIFGITTFELG